MGALKESEGTFTWGLRHIQNLVRFNMSLNDDRNWAAKIYQERADTIDPDRNVTYFFLKDYQEICRYMRTIGYGSKGKADSVEKQVARELEIGGTARSGLPYEEGNPRRISPFSFIMIPPLIYRAPAS